MTLRRLGELLARNCANPKCDKGISIDACGNSVIGKNKLFIPTRTDQKYCSVECKCLVAEERRRNGKAVTNQERQAGKFRRVTQGVWYIGKEWYEGLEIND